jgi:hypothetical protein
VANFRYLGTTVTDQNLIPEEIENRLHSCNACYYSVQNPMISRLLSENTKITIHKSIILPVVLYWRETWVSDVKGRTQKAFDNRILRRTCGLKMD